MANANTGLQVVVWMRVSYQLHAEKGRRSRIQPCGLGVAIRFTLDLYW